MGQFKSIKNNLHDIDTCHFVMIQVDDEAEMKELTGS